MTHDWRPRVSALSILLCDSLGPALEAIPLFALAAKFPDDALGSKLAIAAGVGAGLAVVKTLLTIPDAHLLALDPGIPIRVVSAFHRS